MAMTKEEQKAAAKRIMEKYPMTEEEREIYERLIKKPKDYQPPLDGVRVCGTCGAEFQDIKNGKGEVIETGLQQFSDHQASHNASPAQWTEAYNRIQAGKERAKGRE